MFNKQIVRERIVANKESNIYGNNNLDILLFNKDVSSYKNNVDMNVPRQAINPKKLFFNPKKSRVQL